jgi:outer membrane biosynthesis protein TonB
MSVLYLHYQSPEREGRVQTLARSGAHVIVSEPRWPGFFEQAKKEKPYAIAIDFSHAPSHALETADYLAKARETREASLYLLHVPEDRLEAVRKRLPQAALVREDELSERLARAEKEAAQRALEKKEAAAAARKLAREKKKAEQPQAVKPVAKPKKPAAPPKKTAHKRPAKKKTEKKKKHDTKHSKKK